MKKISLTAFLLTFVGLLMFGIPSGEVWADGNETEGLGAPSIAIAEGSGIVTAGTGLAQGATETISVEVPAGATVNQVLLYWYGRGTPDNTLLVDGNSVVGDNIGENNSGRELPGGPSTTFRADISGLGLVSAGPNSLEVGGWDFTFDEGGAGVIVIFEDASGTSSDLQIVDGHDFAADDQGFDGTDLEFTFPRKFTFDSAEVDRMATMVDLFVANGDPARPDAVEITVGGTVTQTGFEDIDLMGADFISGNSFDSDGFSFSADSNIFIIGEDPTVCGGSGSSTSCADSGSQTLVSLGPAVTIAEASGGTFSLRRLDVAEGIVGFSTPPATAFSIEGTLDGGGTVSAGPFQLDGEIDGAGANDFRTYTLPESFAEAVLNSATIVSEPAGDAFSLDNIVLATPGGDFFRVEDVVIETDGARWDTLRYPALLIPAGETMVTAQVISFDDKPSVPNARPLPDSIAWVAAALTVPPPPEECEGEIGDYVWEDDGDGCQEDNAGIAGVEVCIYDGCVNAEMPIDCTTTDEKGFYLFTGLECGKDYEVKFTRPPGFVETVANSCPDPDNNDETKDSDCVEGERVCVSLGEDTIVQDLTIDCGYVPECDISVDKTCEVIAPDPGLFECDDKVDALKMIWGGPGTLLNVTAYRGDVGDDETLPAVISTEVIDGVERQVVTVTGYQPSTNDVQWEWFSDGVPRSGISEFHLSCSDNEMNGPEDCGKPQGNGKSNDDALDNDWRLDGLTTDKGFVLDCTPELSAGAEECTIQSQIADCESIEALTGDKPDVLTWQYTGGGCDASDNSQDSGDLFCDEFNGGVDGSQAVTITDDDGNVFEVEPGGVFTTTRDASKVFTLVNDGGREDNGRHVSCSQPLIAGDVYGSLTLAALEGIGIGAEVRYVYEVTNNNAVEAITDISVVDDPLATSGVPGSPIAFLAPGASETLELTTFISQTTVNTVTVNGKVNDSPICEASDTVTVTVLDPPPCEVTIVFDKLEDDKIKWKITNVGGRMATLEEFVLDFPDSYGVIEKVKLDGDIYKASESSLVVGPGVPITKDDWTQSDASKRQLDPGETRDLEVEFSKKGDRSGWLGIDPVGGVNFAEGCEGKFPVVGGCALGDPTALIFEYTGDLCSATTNDQEGKFECEETGALGTLDSVAMTKDSDKISVEISGSKVTIFYDDPEGEKFPSEIEYKITGSTGTQSQTLHTSCSKQLNVGDQFGALILQEFVPED